MFDMNKQKDTLQQPYLANHASVPFQEREVLSCAFAVHWSFAA